MLNTSWKDFLAKISSSIFYKTQNCVNFVMYFTQKTSENSKTDFGKLCQLSVLEDRPQIVFICNNMRN